MRIELRLILWVTSFGLLALAIFRGALPVGQLSSDETKLVAVAEQQYLVKFSSDQLTLRAKIGLALPEISTEHRNMFKIEVGSVEEPTTPVMVSTVAAMPILKGIVSQDGSRRAIFEDPASGAGYAVIARGERFQGFEIREIGTDYVIAAPPDGDAVTLKLRGAGETP